MNETLPILAIETSGDLCSAAVLLGEKNFVELNYLQKHIHSQKLIDIIDAVLKNANVELKQIKSIAVSMGPGSFTGLRIGLSAVKGIAFGAGLPIIPVPTFDAYAFNIARVLPDGSKFIIAINANIDELYFEKFVKKEKYVKAVDTLRLLEKSNLNNFVEDGEFVYGNISFDKIINEIAGPTAFEIGRWAYLFGNDLLTYNYDYLEPNYFKKFIPKVKA